MKIFFTSDLHFGHENVIAFDGRPFDSVKEMNEELIRRWNLKVGKEDTVYVLGDLIWKTANNEAESILRQLNGEIVLIKGNHDTFIKNNRKASSLLREVKEYDDICVALEDGTIKRCILSHYYMPLYNGHRLNAIHLHGHSHNTVENSIERYITDMLKRSGYNPQIYNVGCMLWNYEPVTLDEILARKNK